MVLTSRLALRELRRRVGGEGRRQLLLTPSAAQAPVSFPFTSYSSRVNVPCAKTELLPKCNENTSPSVKFSVATSLAFLCEIAVKVSESFLPGSAQGHSGSRAAAESRVPGASSVQCWAGASRAGRARWAGGAEERGGKACGSQPPASLEPLQPVCAGRLAEERQQVAFGDLGPE